MDMKMENERIIDLFEKTAVIHGDKEAVIIGNEAVTYRELNHKASQLAAYLKGKGVHPGSYIGIFMERSVESVISILGILKSGCGYVPIDNKCPKSRLSYIVKDAGIKTILTQQTLLGKLERIQGLENVALTCIEQSFSLFPEMVLPVTDEAFPDIACIIYTSGTTGMPKGVITANENLCHYVTELAGRIGIKEDDRYLHTASIAFSSSNRQLLLTLTAGATVVIAEAEEKINPIAMFQLIKKQQVTIIDLVPSHMRSCLQALRLMKEEERDRLLENRLRLILSASEALLSDIPKGWKTLFKREIKCMNMYGSTETTGILCTYEIKKEDCRELKVISIGRPLDSMQIYILDKNMVSVHKGEIGMLYAAGPQVTRNYQNKPELSEKSFLTYGGQRLFCTGDLCRLGENENIEYAGRRDQQIKINGIRIETKEIEINLNQYQGILESVVCLRKIKNQKVLAAFYVSSKEEDFSAVELRKFLSDTLPDYMIPAHYVRLDSIPLTANGKVDSFRLSEIDISSVFHGMKITEPTNDTERVLCGIWRSILKLECVGIHNNFFELGGSSILAFQVVSKIYKDLNIDMPVVQLFELPTIHLLADYIQNQSIDKKEKRQKTSQTRIRGGF